MATTAATPNRLTANTMSDDLNLSDGITATSTTDGWLVALGAKGNTDQLLICLLDDGSGATVTVKAGDYPLAKRAALGDLTLTLAASDARYLMLEAGRFEQDDNTIQVVSSDAGTKILCFLIPHTRSGGTGVS